MRKPAARKELAKDLLFIIVGAIVALVLSDLGIIDHLIALFGSSALASFTAGIFFTSVFTIAPASVALGHIALTADPHVVALWGALGAVCGDLILFYFIRDRFADDLVDSFGSVFAKHIISSFHVGFLKWLSPIFALIIASPLPDEFGVALLGVSRVRAYVMIPVSFIGNILGIYLIVWFGSIL
jgi:uncharacterized membrane protein YdjX (TVP38/TMEM64 family)